MNALDRYDAARLVLNSCERSEILEYLLDFVRFDSVEGDDSRQIALRLVHGGVDLVVKGVVVLIVATLTILHQVPFRKNLIN